MILQFDFSPRASAIFTYSVCWRMGLMHCGKRGSQTERETEADKLVQKFRHCVLCCSGSLLMRHWDVYTANNNEISDGQTAGGGARIRDEDRQEERGLKEGGKEEGKDYTTCFPKPMCRCTDSPALLYCQATGKLQNGAEPSLSPSLSLSVFLAFPLCLLSFLLTVGICPGCAVCLSVFRYVSADFVFTIHNFSEFIISSPSVLNQYMCLQLPKAYLSN